MADEAVVLGTITLPGVHNSVGHARTFLRDLLPPAHPTLDDLVTVASEAVTNAITHTASGNPGGRVSITLAASHRILILEVADDGAGGSRPYLREEDGTESGRGMRIIDALARRWGLREDASRTLIWAEFPDSLDRS
jgi:anti-sigma regulatory factor (Ser/Thr protein kinase)